MQSMRTRNAPPAFASCADTLPTWRSLVDSKAVQAVYGLLLEAPEGKSDLSPEGAPYIRLFYVGASNDETVVERALAAREPDCRVARLRASGWATRLLFLERGAPLGTEDAVTTALRVQHRRDPGTLVLGGVAAALASPAYASTRRSWLRLADNSALGACLRCSYEVGAGKRVVPWTRCVCKGKEPPPEERARLDAAAVAPLRAQVASLRAQVAALSSKLSTAAAAAKLAANKARALETAVLRAEARATAAETCAGCSRQVPAPAVPAGTGPRRPSLKRPAAADPPTRGEQTGVLICGELYTTLRAYFGCAGHPPTKAQRRAVYAACVLGPDAVELVGGDAKTLKSKGFFGAALPRLELVGRRASIPDSTTPTKCTAAKKGSSGF